MGKRANISPEETAELQRLYSELPGAIAEAAHLAQPRPEAEDLPEEKVDTILRRILQLEPPD